MSDASNAPALVSVSREDSVSRRPREARREAVLDPLANVARANGVDALAERLEELKALLADDLMQIELAIQGIDAEVREPTVDFRSPMADSRLSITDSRSPMADDRSPKADGLLARRAARQLLDRPGKRIRPLCVLLAARMGGRSLDNVVRNLAVACEIVHAATLLHDDVLDQGNERRGAATARLIYGNSASILGGDHLLVEALKLVDSANEPTLLRSLLQVISEMVHAEAIQLEQRGRFRPEREVYLKVIHGKTAALFRWGLTAGGVVAKLSADSLGHLARVGDALGMAFQLIDDVIDLEGTTAVTGKTPLADLREGKLTWPVIVAAERDAALARDLEHHVRGNASDDLAFAKSLVERIRATGALQVTRAYAEQQGERAAEELAHLPAGPARDAIAMVVRDAIRRSK